MILQVAKLPLQSEKRRLRMVTNPEVEMLKEADLAVMTETEERRSTSREKEVILAQIEIEGTRRTRKINEREAGPDPRSGKSGEEIVVAAEIVNIGHLAILMIEEINMSTKIIRISTKREKG